jgi:hypothetical protein
MLIYIRGDLLGKDNMGCLQRLMKYPPVEDVKVFVKSALDSRHDLPPPPLSIPHDLPPHPHPALLRRPATRHRLPCSEVMTVAPTGGY